VLMRPQLILLLKLLAYTLVLNVLRYYPGGWLEMYTIMEPMHEPMAMHPDAFGFTSSDLPSSYFYNFMLWLAVVLIFHIAKDALTGKMIIRSLKVFALCCLFFCSLAAVYMNHFNQDIRTFFMYSMLDAVLLFSFLGSINGLLYPLFFKSQTT
jgi:hypothetical protein